MSDVAAVTWIDHKEPEKRRVAIQCGRHLLVSPPMVGNYPGYKQVIPRDTPHIADIPHNRKPGASSPGCDHSAKASMPCGSTGTSAASSP